MDQILRDFSTGIDALHEPFESRPLNRGVVFLALCGLTWGTVALVGWAFATLFR